HGRADDDDTAHRGRAALGEVRRRAVLPDELAVVAAHEEPDEQRRAQQRDEQRDGAGDDDGDDHGVAAPSAPVGGALPFLVRPTQLEALTSTASPGRSSPRRSCSASSTSAAWCPPLPPATAAASNGAVPAPTATTSSMPSSAA